MRPQAVEGEAEEKDEQVIPPSAGASGMPRPNMAISNKKSNSIRFFIHVL